MNIYETSDLGQAAAIISAGFDLQKIDNTNQQKMLFVFNNNNRVSEIADMYWSNKVLVDARTYFENVKMLKSRIYGRG